MPGLYAFNRRWGIGSDDLVYPIIVENCLRFAWLIAISVVFHINRDAFDCASGHLLRIYFIGVITIISVSAFLNIIIIHYSMKGTITNVVPRRRIPLMLYIKLSLLIPEGLWVIMGTYWAFGLSYHCERAVVWTVKGAVIFAWMAGIFVVIGILLVFDPVGTKKQRNRMNRRMAESAELVASDAGVTARKVWEMRCRLLCCCVAFKQDNDNAFNDVSKLIADFFEDVDLVPTDIAAGLILVQHRQSCRDHQLESVMVEKSGSGQAEPDGAKPSTSDVSSALCPVPENWMTIKMMSHFMRYALGSYGWPFYVYNNLATGICKLASKCKCCSCMRSSENVYFDNACQCHTAAIRKITGISDQDLVYVSFHNKFKEIPFYIAVDREHKSVVISIRGTLSLEDALVDMSAEGKTVDLEGVEDAYVHGAILDCAEYIKERIDSLDLLTKAFNSLPDCSRLVVVGHSLGAGAAAILAILLKPQYPDLICFAYSPPGGLMSPSASAHVRSYVCSVVVGKDLIPRLGMPTMNHLKTQIMKALDESKLPKYRILAKGCMKIACGCIQSDFDADAVSRREPLLENGSGASYSVNEADNAQPQDALREAMCESHDTDKEWPMHPPGQILHIEEVEDRGFCTGIPEYCASWAHPDDFKEILISPSMVLDHFPDVVLDSLVQLNERNYIPRTKQRQISHVST